MRHRYIFAFLIPFLLSSNTVFGDKSVNEYLTEGNNFLTSGQFNDALISFDAAITKEPDNYLSYFKRATAYLSLGRQNAAIDDFSKIIQLKPDFDQILLERARIYVNEGQFQLAITDLERYKKRRKEISAEVDELLTKAKIGQSSLAQAEIDKKNKKFDSCIALTTQVTRMARNLAHAWSLRAECHLAKGELDEAAGDLARVAQLKPSNPDTLLLLAKIKFYVLNEPQGALAHIKQCLHYDPEQKNCKKLFREMKKINKEMASIENSVESKKYSTASNHLIGTANRQGILTTIDTQFDFIEKELNNYNENNSIGKAIPKRLHARAYHLACKISAEQENKDDEKLEKWCTKSLEINSEDELALLSRGELLLGKKEFERAVNDLEKANEIMSKNMETNGSELSREQQMKLRQLLQRAQQQWKMSKKKDYYKLLEVSPTADSREIKKAYRKKAHEWHPDKYTGELEKEEVVKKMAEINQAYQVLSDPDMRQQYDNGFDPFDPEQGSAGSGGGNPTGFNFQQHGGNPFFFQNGFPFGGPGGGGGFHGEGSHSFKMHF